MKKMDAVRAHKQKMRAKSAHQIPSFVYRQDGHELSYVIIAIIPPPAAVVKMEKPPWGYHGGLPQMSGKKRDKKRVKMGAYGLRPPYEDIIAPPHERCLTKLKIKFDIFMNNPPPQKSG